MSEPASGPPYDVSQELLQAYYLLQYERVASTESGRLQVSNYVVAASVVALGVLAIPDSVDGWVFVVVGVLIGLANVVAINYTRTSVRWVKVHQTRANYALLSLSPELYRLQSEANAEADVGRLRGGASVGGDDVRNKSLTTSEILISILHYCFIAAALFLSIRAFL